MHHHHHAHPHRSLPEIFALIDRSALSEPGRDAGEGAVSAAGGRRGGDPPDAGRAGPPARGRRPRFDHRHRRRGVRRSSGSAPTDRLLAAQRRRRHGPVGARGLSGAGAGDGEPARRRADLWRAGAEGARHADRRADRRRTTRRRSGRFRRCRSSRSATARGSAISRRRRTCCASWSGAPRRRPRPIASP